MDNARLLFRPAGPSDLGRIREIIRQAQTRMRLLGIDQWQDGYPAHVDIERDILSGDGRVLCRPEDGRAVACGAVIFGPEPAYAVIAGAWLGDDPYAVVHRLAVADGETGRGAAGEFLHRAEALAAARGIRSMRIDTHSDNRAMLRLLDKRGYVYCGKIRCRSGERLAFEKRLGPH